MPSGKTAFEERDDRRPAVGAEVSRAGAGEVRVPNHRLAGRARKPGLIAPREPAVAFLIEDEERLVTELGELRAPARSALDRVIRQDRADHVDLLAVVDLVPDALEHLPDGG